MVNGGKMRMYELFGILMTVRAKAPKSRFSRIPALAILTLTLMALPRQGGAQPKLAIPIPNLKLSGITNVQDYLVFPWLAQYIGAIYTYVTGAAGVVAGVMLIVGGFQYMTAGGDASRAGAAKTRIVDATVGLFLVLGSYMILATVNPTLVELSDLQIRKVEQTLLQSHIANRDGVPAENAQPWDAPPPAGPPGPAMVPATDPKGNYVAQENCPADMVAIPRSEEYKPQGSAKNVPAFCIDRFEAPNVGGTKPFIGIMEWEAEWYCLESGKRLCSYSEWVRACLGPKGENTYGYGPAFIPGPVVSKEEPNKWAVRSTGKGPAPCNYDTVKSPPLQHGLLLGMASKFPMKMPSHSLLRADNPRLQDPTIVSIGGDKKTYKEWQDKLKDYLDKVADSAGPSGSRKDCKTAEGVMDMVGSTQEIVVKDNAADLTAEQRIAKGDMLEGAAKPYTWVSFYFSPIAHLANTAAKPNCTVTWGGPHALRQRWMENGFRCCLNLKEKPKE
jgi:hypothetical protein